MLCPPKNHEKADIVFTPPRLAKEVIDHFAPTGKVLDPCRGNGAFYNQFPESCEKDWCEITEGRSFFYYQKKVDWIITNPPWSLFKEFLEMGMRISDHVVYLVIINHFMTKSRLKTMRKWDFGFKEIYCVPTPTVLWPPSGFQLAAVHVEKGWRGPTLFTGEVGS
jgi:hypothetical protein